MRRPNEAGAARKGVMLLLPLASSLHGLRPSSQGPPTGIFVPQRRNDLSWGYQGTLRIVAGLCTRRGVIKVRLVQSVSGVIKVRTVDGQAPAAGAFQDNRVFHGVPESVAIAAPYGDAMHLPPDLCCYPRRGRAFAPLG